MGWMVFASLLFLGGIEDANGVEHGRLEMSLRQDTPPAEQPVYAEVGRDGALVLYPPSVSEQDARAILDDTLAARSVVAAHLGAAPLETVTVILSLRSRTPNSGGGRIAIPVDRVALRGPDRDALTLVHEMTHLYEWGVDATWYLAEGLAVHVQDAIGKPAYPTNGADFHALTRSLEAELGLTIPIAQSESAKMGASPEKRRLAYIQEGSFVRWLIEGQGLPKLLELVRGAPAESVYGKSIEELERDWRSMLATYPAAAE